MPTIIVKVDNKIATNQTPEVKIVCGNSDYVVNFEFDEEWSGQNVKTALFAYNNGVEPVVFEGNSCEMPILRNTTLVGIGVKAGDLRTTTPAYADCLKSISDIGGEIAPPKKSVYDQIMDLLNKALSQSTAVPVGGKKNQVLAKKSDEDYDTHWVDDQAGGGGIPEETVREIVAEETASLTSVKVNGEAVAEFDADTKLDKIVKIKRLYATDQNGQQTDVSYTNNQVGSVVVQRNGDATIQHPTSKGDYNCVNNLRLNAAIDETVLTGASPPTEETKAQRVGQLYIDTINNRTYQCSAITTDEETSLTTYNWVQLIRSTDRASTNTPGVMRVSPYNGAFLNESGHLCIAPANKDYITGRRAYAPITANYLDYAIILGITENTTPLTDEEKTKACEWLGVTDLVGDINTALEAILGV